MGFRFSKKKNIIIYVYLAGGLCDLERCIEFRALHVFCACRLRDEMIVVVVCAGFQQGRVVEIVQGHHIDVAHGWLLRVAGSAPIEAVCARAR